MNNKDWKYDPKNVGIDALTLRDFFAAQALNGILANPTLHLHPTDMGDVEGFLHTARIAYKHADAMLAVPTEK